MRELILFSPEIFMALTLGGIILSEVGYYGERSRLITATALLGLGGAFVQILLIYGLGPATAMSKVISVDGLSLFFKLLAVVLGGLSIICANASSEIGQDRRAETYALIIAGCLALSVVAGAADILLAFLALQCLNLICFGLVAFARRSSSSVEASIKHMISSAVAAGLLLFGFVILFAHTKTLNIYEMHTVLISSPLPPHAALVSLALIFLSLCFQMGAFPMHLWMPDVLQGAPTPIAGFVAVAVRLAGLAVAIRFFVVLFAQAKLSPGQWMVMGSVDWPQMMAIVSGLTMSVGALLAFRQHSAKRLLASLFVSETGFFLMGLLVLDQMGMAALLYNVGVQVFAWTGAFYVVGFLYDQLKSDHLTDLSGIMSRAAPECIFLLLCLVCIAGLPPFPGFLGQFALVGAAIRHDWYALAIVAILSRALIAIATARIGFSLVGNVTQQLAEEAMGTLPAPVAVSPGRRVFLFALLMPMVLIGVFAEVLLDWAGKSLHFILW